jgi:hypothetical protein
VVKAIVTIGLRNWGRRRSGLVEKSYYGVHLREKKAVSSVDSTLGCLLLQRLDLSAKFLDWTFSRKGVAGAMSDKSRWLWVVVHHRRIFSLLRSPKGKHLPRPGFLRTAALARSEYRFPKGSHSPRPHILSAYEEDLLANHTQKAQSRLGLECLDKPDSCEQRKREGSGHEASKTSEAQDYR